MMKALLGGLCVLAVGCGGEEFSAVADGGFGIASASARSALGSWSAATVDLSGSARFLARDGFLLGNFGGAPSVFEYPGVSSPGTWDSIPGGSVVATNARLSMSFLRPYNLNGLGGFQGNERHVFTRHATNNNVIHQVETFETAFSTTAWKTGWDNSVGTNPILGSPTVAERGTAIGPAGAQDIDIFVRGTDNNIYENTYTGNNSNNTIYIPGTHGSWSGYASLGAPTGGLSSGTSPSSASALGVVNFPERDVFVQDSSNALAWRRHKGGTWSSWSQVASNPFIGSPVAIKSSAANAIDVYVMGTNGLVYVNRMTIINPNTSGTSRSFNWSGYVECGKPSGVTLDTSVLAVGRATEGGVEETKIFVKDTSGTVFKASGECM